MANDSRIVLNQLVRSGLWSTTGNIQGFKKIILDSESAITFLYQYCASKHVRRQKSLIGTRSIDYYSATIVNYTEFSRYIEQLLEFFISRNVELVIVYRGKPMEAPIFGSLPAQIKKNTQRVLEPLKLLVNYANVGPKAIDEHKLRPWRPNLALNIFKLIVNSKQTKGSKIKTHQAFYSSYPIMAKLAKDLKCPVLTNDGEFIILDVRAGFVLFEDFWRTHIESTNVVSRSRSISNTSSQSKSPKSPNDIPITSANSLFSLRTGKQPIRFNYCLKFLRQHPGLNPSIALQLFPITNGEFIITHSFILMRLKIYNRQYKEKDLITSAYNRENQISKYHMAAARLEQAIRYLSAKNPDVLNNIFRGEAVKYKSSFDDDIHGLFNYYAVSYDFKNRLKFILKNNLDTTKASYIEACLLNRECSADYLLNILSCSIGHFSSLSYNKSIQFEDLKAKKSANSMLDRSKCLLMSILSDNKTFESEYSALVRNHETLHKRYNLASLTIIDREHSNLVERELKTSTQNDTQFDSLRNRISLEAIARKNAIKQDSLNLISFVFKTNNIGKLATKHQTFLDKYSIKNDQFILSELTIVLALQKFCIETASLDDKYFKQNYLDLGKSFELAILNHYLYIHQVSSRSTGRKGLGQLIDLINRHDFENVAAQPPALPSGDQSKRNNSSDNNNNNNRSNSRKSSNDSRTSGSSVKQTMSSSPRVLSTSESTQRVKKLKSTISSSASIVPESKIEQQADISPISKQIRHLIELLNSSLEAYMELNAFLNYPAPKISLNLHYNPILLYNLTQFCHNNPTNKSMLKY